MGKFVMKTNEKGSRFVLKAGNGEIIGVSETYWTGEMVAADPSGFCVFLALDAGVPVGYLDLGLGDGGSNVADLYVDKDHRRRGWGRKLLGKAIRWNGARALTLQVDVDNGPAIRLYEGMGFRFVPDSGRMDAIWRIDG